MSGVAEACMPEALGGKVVSRIVAQRSRAVKVMVSVSAFAFEDHSNHLIIFMIHHIFRMITFPFQVIARS